MLTLKKTLAFEATALSADEARRKVVLKALDCEKLMSARLLNLQLGQQLLTQRVPGESDAWRSSFSVEYTVEVSTIEMLQHLTCVEVP